MEPQLRKEIDVFGDALLFTAVYVLGVLSVAALILWWVVTGAYGRHAGARNEAVSVGALEDRIRAEVQVLVDTTRPISPERLFPRLPEPPREPPASVWTLPELVAA